MGFGLTREDVAYSVALNLNKDHPFKWLLTFQLEKKVVNFNSTNNSPPQTCLKLSTGTSYILETCLYDSFIILLYFHSKLLCPFLSFYRLSSHPVVTGAFQENKRVSADDDQ